MRACGALRRENVGMSNHNPNEKLEPRKSKVSVALAINHGLGGPKAIPKGAADGKLVNIPVPALVSMGRRGSERPAGQRMFPLKRVVISCTGKSVRDGERDSTAKLRQRR